MEPGPPPGCTADVLVPPALNLTTRPAYRVTHRQPYPLKLHLQEGHLIVQLLQQLPVRRVVCRGGVG